MDVRRLALMVGALMVAAVSAVMARSLFMGSATPQAAASMPAAPVAPTGPEVLVATRAMPVGTIIGPDSFRYQPWPSELIEKAYFIRGQSEAQTLVGTVVRQATSAGQPITQGSLVKPGDRGFLAAALGPGMRAVTVSVSAQSGVAGFVFPGDRVDLILASQVTASGDDQPLRASETIVRNLRVLATDQRTDKVTDEQGKTMVSAFSSVTLETTPRIAEKIAVAQSIGTLSLSLRPLANDTAELERAIAAGEVDVPATGGAKAEKDMILAIANRPSDSDTSYTLGADVSRFQRRSVPVAQQPMAMGGPAPAPAAPAPAYQPTGPVVRVARGNAVSVVALGAK
ncbi:Flp pilus assembly protein CpaB [Sphingomonas naphthae]|uniref:Flp pilus assembly protein CpaB n=1 Tax=Sphingomonas naphthae TaxID=1813468 RepID=A0ABY7TIJ7_9SPHN|nr:Flp pilus assembly protein CpaB [Sphingomonas naphthae]WCT72149.1 Flp pilus assembly protein CpaB [Sphingomonas naphthae]